MQATRRDPRVEVGASPRGTIAIFQLAKSHAAFNGRDFVIPDDIKIVTIPALSHRLILKTETRIKGEKPEDILGDILSNIKVPMVD